MYITRNGIRHTIFIDDGKVNAEDQETMIWAFKFVINALKRAGFVVSQKKSDSLSSVSQKKAYLGFDIDSKLMRITAKQEKVEAMEQALDAVINSNRKVRAKDLASVVGKAIALQPATGPIVQLLTRSAQLDIVETVDKFGWKGWIALPEDTKQTLAELRQVLKEFNGATIKTTETETPLRAILEDCKSEGLLYGWDVTQTRQIVADDASDRAVCAYEVEGIPDLYVQAKLSKEEREYSSGHRELLTIKRTLQNKKDLLTRLPSKTILWLTDSTNMVAFLSKGSTKRHILPDIMAVHREARRLNLTIVPVHVTREDYRIQAADEGTRYFDPDDWGIDMTSFDHITRKKKPTVDLFAHYSNKKVGKFYSYGRAPHSSGTDAMTQCWDKEVACMCPPTSLVIEAFKKACHSVMEAYVLVPAWPSATYWTFLFPDGKHAHEVCKRVEHIQPFVLRGEFCQNCLLQGRTDFPFLIMFISSDGSGYRFKSGRIENPMLRNRK